MNTETDDIFYKMATQSKDGYFLFNVAERKFDFLNAHVSEITGLEQKVLDFSPGKLLDQIHPDDLEHAIYCYEECIVEKKTAKYEFRLLNPTVKHVRIGVFPMETSDQFIICGILEDITVAINNKINTERINKKKNITLEVLSHDLREPFGLIRMTASALTNQVKVSGNENLLEGLAFIRDMCDRNIKLVRSIINHEFLKSAEIELKKDRVEMVFQLREIIRFYKRSQLKFTRRFDFTASDESIYATIDNMKIQQVINNLISNAIKFTVEGDLIRLRVEEKSETILISLQDSGIGIAEEKQPVLFDLAEAGLKPGLKGEESGGLGMGIIKHIVDLHQGKIWFDTVKNVGTTFFIEVPK